jgi:hypothetical protein
MFYALARPSAVGPEFVTILPTPYGLLAYYIVIAADRARHGGTHVAAIK